MKISVITVCYNAADTIADALRSVATQSHTDIEHIIVDGGSTDDTLATIRRMSGPISHLISGPDKGLYDAINKGMALAAGDYVGILHADDVFADDNALARVAAAATGGEDFILGGIDYVRRDDITRKVRRYRSVNFRRSWFLQGDMPPHPGAYHRRDVFDRIGNYDLSFKMSSDFDFLLRALYLSEMSFRTIPGALVHMRIGGLSSSGLVSKQRIYEDIMASALKHGVPVTKAGILRKYLRKMTHVDFPGVAGLRRAAKGKAV